MLADKNDNLCCSLPSASQVPQPPLEVDMAVGEPDLPSASLWVTKLWRVTVLFVILH